jgi:hypothetical protein
MKHLTKIYLLGFLVFADIAAFAAPGDDTGGGDLGGGDPPAAPINSNLTIMIGLALVFAFYSIRKYRKQIY